MKKTSMMLMAVILLGMAPGAFADDWHKVEEISADGKNAREVAVNRRTSAVRIKCIEGSVIINTIVRRDGGNKQSYTVGQRLNKDESRTIEFGDKVNVSGFRISEDGRGRYRIEVKK